MKKIVALLTALFVTSTVAWAEQTGDVSKLKTGSPVMQTDPIVVKNQRDIELVFVVDTTGSMGGLIQGAKTKIWSIVNDVMQHQAKNTKVKIGLVAYRDRGDDYVTKITDLNDNLDTVYTKLMDFKAIGGGDEPEDVQRALSQSLTDIQWSQAAPNVSRIVFLVGDARPHTDYKDYPSTAKTAQKAHKQGIIINTIQCGNLQGTDKFWREIAQYANGEYFAIEQNGGVQTIVTPYDEELVKLGTKMDSHYIPYGMAKTRTIAVEESRKNAAVIMAAAPMEASADRAVNKSINSYSYAENDLIQNIENGTLTLAQVKDEELPEDMQKMSVSEREAYVNKMIAERKTIRSEIMALSKKRDQYIQKNTKTSGDGFDQAVSKALQKQIKY